MASYIVNFIYNDSFRIDDVDSPRDAFEAAKRLAKYGWDDYEVEDVEEEED